MTTKGDNPQPQFIFGYGSFLESGARVMTSPAALHAAPVNVAGIQRGWFGRLAGVGLSQTYLGAVADESSTCNGVIFAVPPQQLEAFDEYEAGYHRERIGQRNITMLDGSEAAPAGDIWFYANAEKHEAAPEFPIVQSYIDVCLSGCFEIEAMFPLAQEAEFAETFLKTSTNWNQYWVNDRLCPRWPSLNNPDASRIDELIRKVMGEALFSSIAIEPDGKFQVSSFGKVQIQP